MFSVLIAKDVLAISKRQHQRPIWLLYPTIYPQELSSFALILFIVSYLFASKENWKAKISIFSKNYCPKMEK